MLYVQAWDIIVLAIRWPRRPDNPQFALSKHKFSQNKALDELYPGRRVLLSGFWR